jgi:hypothetical protein
MTTHCHRVTPTTELTVAHLNKQKYYHGDEMLPLPIFDQSRVNENSPMPPSGSVVNLLLREDPRNRAVLLLVRIHKIDTEANEVAKKLGIQV